MSLDCSPGKENFHFDLLELEHNGPWDFNGSKLDIHNSMLLHTQSNWWIAFSFLVPEDFFLYPITASKLLNYKNSYTIYFWAYIIWVKHWTARAQMHSGPFICRNVNSNLKRIQLHFYFSICCFLRLYFSPVIYDVNIQIY